MLNQSGKQLVNTSAKKYVSIHSLHAVLEISLAIVQIQSFYAQKQLLLLAHLGHRSSIRSSVCQHGWISQKRCKPGSPNLHHRQPGRL